MSGRSTETAGLRSHSVTVQKTSVIGGNRTMLKSRASRIALMFAFAVVSAAPVGLSGVAHASQVAAPAVQSNVALFRQLMELNGTSQNARQVITNNRKVILEAIEADRGGALNDADRARFDTLADAAFASLTEQVLNLIAADQSPGFTEAEIRTLIAANSGLAAATYNAAKFKNEAEGAEEIQGYMVDSVVEIIKAFEDSSTIASLTPLSDEPARVVQAADLLVKDGTEQVVDHFVGSVHRGLIFGEVEKYIDVPALSDAERARLDGVVKVSIDKLSDRILRRSARLYGQALTREQLTTLIAANDTPAQRKLTRLRVEGGDAADARAGEMIMAVANELATAFRVEAS